MNISTCGADFGSVRANFFSNNIFPGYIDPGEGSYNKILRYSGKYTRYRSYIGKALTTNANRPNIKTLRLILARKTSNNKN